MKFSLSMAAAFLAAASYIPVAGAQWGSGSTTSGWSSSQGSCASGSAESDRRSSSLQVVGLTSDNRLICFNENSPGDARAIGFVSNLSQGDTALVGIDFRVQDGRLYGVGDKGGIYSIDISNAVAVRVSQLTAPLNGSSFGVDFNPAADRLRVVSDTGQNLRHNIAPGGTTIVDGTLNYTPGTPAPGIVGSAYTNNDLNADTATTLYALDSALDQIAIQSPPNAGTLAATGKLTVDSTAVAGFDIYSTVRSGSTVDVQALASLKLADGTNALFSVKLPTGKATLRGNFPSQFNVTDIAIPLNQL